MYEDLYFSGDGIPLSIVAVGMFLMIDWFTTARAAKAWQYLRLFSPCLVGMAIAPFLPAVNPVPDDSAFLTATLIGFGSLFAYSVWRREQGLPRVVAGFLLACYATLAGLAIVRFLACF